MQAHLWQYASHQVEVRLATAWATYSARPPPHDPVNVRSYQQLVVVWQHVKPGVESLYSWQTRVDQVDEGSPSTQLVYEYIFERLNEVARGLEQSTATATNFKLEVGQILRLIRYGFKAVNVPLPDYLVEVYNALQPRRSARALGKQSRYCRIGLRAQRHYGVTEEELQRRWS